ncbi:MAG: Gfo/Idh/MocA family oxidoreductase [Verrucomicrobiota bacterium]
MKSNLARRDFIKTTGLVAATAAFASPLATLAQAAGGKVTLAIVGGAHIHTPDFGRRLKGREDVVVKYVWDHDAARAEKRAKEAGSKTTANVQEIWDDKEVTGVVICSETNRHLELVAAAAKAGKHMFVEKPLGVTAKDSAAMAATIEQAGRLFTTGYFMRTFPAHLLLKELVAKNAFGKITRVRGSNCHSGSLGGWFDTDWRWMADPKQSGCGGFGDLGTHSLDILMWLMGDVESITADIKVITARYGDTDECGEALIKFRNGVTGTLAAGWVDVADPVTLLISGTEGHAHMLNGDLYLKCKNIQGADGKQPWKQLPQPPPLPIYQFVEAVSGKRDMPLVTSREAAARVAVMEAAYQSAKTGTWQKPV